MAGPLLRYIRSSLTWGSCLCSSEVAHSGFTTETSLPLICALEGEAAKASNPKMRLLVVENCMPSCVLIIVKMRMCVCMHMNAHLLVSYFVFMLQQVLQDSWELSNVKIIKPFIKPK